MVNTLIALFIWMPVTNSASGWVYQTDFTMQAKCVAAARQLELDLKNYRCVAK